MGIKAVKCGKEKNELDFPKLMKSNSTGMILLATKREHGILDGTVVYKGDGSYDVGYYDNDWASSKFNDFVGAVRLENKEG